MCFKQGSNRFTLRTSCTEGRILEDGLKTVSTVQERYNDSLVQAC